jgi:hypothetical protein
MNGEKKFWQSKSFWFNALAFVIAILANFGYTGEVPEELGQFVLPVVFLINVVLRFITKQKITI